MHINPTEFCQSLIRIDTSQSERAAADLVADALRAAGLHPVVFEPAPGRTNVVLRIDADDAIGTAVLIHGHLDVVPVDDPADWTAEPFGGEIRDGWICGRGAVDMKGFAAVMVALACDIAAGRVVPRRSLVFAWLADEERGSEFGSKWLCANRPDLISGCEVTIGEIGGCSVSLMDGRRCYPVMTSERSVGVVELSASGRSGHGGLAVGGAVDRLVSALGRLSGHVEPRVRTPPVLATLTTLERLLHRSLVSLCDDELVSALGYLNALVTPMMVNSAVVTELHAGSSWNTAPGRATARLDCRVLLGHRGRFEQTLDVICGTDVRWSWQWFEEGYDHHESEWLEEFSRAVDAHDKGSQVVPYGAPGSTDGRVFHQYGMTNYGFTPLLLPPRTNFGALFHGVDERVPTAALDFGLEVMRSLVDGTGLASR